jgi:Ca2+-binding EF-hand superfamily protein
MDTSSINSHPSLVTTRLAHVGRPPGQARSGSETTARIQGIPQEPPAVAKTVRAPATLKAAAPRQIAGKGEGQGGQSMLEQLKADWGKAESPWDLNADGTVDIRDVLRLLAKIGGGARDAVEVPEQVIPNVNPVPQDVAEPGEEGNDGKTPIQQLLADWGKADSEWDLNGDGTVNIRDFLQLLAQMGGGANDAPPITTHLSEKAETITESLGDADEPAEPKTPVEQLLADWGKADSEWDLNGDGTVNIRDFLQLLAKIGGGVYDGRTPPSGPAPNAEAMAIDDSKIDEAPESKSRIEQLLADWGSSDSRWDVNGDGTVNIRDFLQMLSKMDKASRAEDAPQEPAPRVGHMARRAQAAYSPTTAQDLAMIRRGLSLNAVG